MCNERGWPTTCGGGALGAVRFVPTNSAPRMVTTAGGIVYLDSTGRQNTPEQLGPLEMEKNEYREEVTQLIKRLFDIFNYYLQGNFGPPEGNAKAKAQEQLIRNLAQQLLGDMEFEALC